MAEPTTEPAAPFAAASSAQRLPASKHDNEEGDAPLMMVPGDALLYDDSKLPAMNEEVFDASTLASLKSWKHFNCRDNLYLYFKMAGLCILAGRLQCNTVL